MRVLSPDLIAQDWIQSEQKTYMHVRISAFICSRSNLPRQSSSPETATGCHHFPDQSYHGLHLEAPVSVRMGCRVHGLWRYSKAVNAWPPLDRRLRYFDDSRSREVKVTIGSAIAQNQEATIRRTPPVKSSHTRGICPITKPAPSVLPRAGLWEQVRYIGVIWYLGVGGSPSFYHGTVSQSDMLEESIPAAD
jgi:hypothetical protein